MPAIQRCTNPDHKGLTFRCPRDPVGKCAVCLACDADHGSCGPHICDFTFPVRYREMTDEEYATLPTIPLEVLLLVRSLAEHKYKLEELSQLLHSIYVLSKETS